MAGMPGKRRGPANSSKNQLHTINTSILSHSEKCYLVGPYLPCTEKVLSTEPGKHKLISHGNLLTMPTEELERKVSVVLEIIQHYQEIKTNMKNNPHGGEKINREHVMSIRELREQMRSTRSGGGSRKATEARHSTKQQKPVPLIHSSEATPTKDLPALLKGAPPIATIISNIIEIKYPNRATDNRSSSMEKMLLMIVEALNQHQLIEPREWMSSAPFLQQPNPEYQGLYDNWLTWCKTLPPAKPGEQTQRRRMCDVFGQYMLRAVLPQMKLKTYKIAQPEFKQLLPQVFEDIEAGLSIHHQTSIVLSPNFKQLLAKYRRVNEGSSSSQLVSPSAGAGKRPRLGSASVEKGLRSPESASTPSKSKTASSKEKEDDSVSARLKRPMEEERTGVVKCLAVYNDGSATNNQWMVMMKQHFCRALPKMPKEYIFRLCFDRKHKHLALVKDGHVIAGVCFRPFPIENQRFAEIVFLAVNGIDQVKGYGTHLVNHLKEYMKADEIYDFLTYADNYAVGFFAKQGFHKGVDMDASRWQGFVKDYKDSTLMHCHINQHINYLDIPGIIAQQRKVVDERIRLISKTHQVTYPGLNFSKGNAPVEPGQFLRDIPGLKESGYKPSVTQLSVSQSHKRMERLFEEFRNHRCAWPFNAPVSVKDVPDYFDVIKDPIDLTVVEARLKTGRFYITKETFVADLKRILDNCRLYNHPSTEYYKCADELELYFEPRFDAL